MIKEAKYKVGDYVQMSDVMDEHTSYNDDVFEIVEVDQNLFHDDKRTKSSCYTYKLHKKYDGVNYFILESCIKLCEKKISRNLKIDSILNDVEK